MRLVLDNEGQHASRWQAIVSISAKIGCTPQTLNEWVKKAEVDGGRRAGIPTEMAEKMKALERENRELRQANEILRKVSAYFAPPLGECLHSPVGQLGREGFNVARCTVARLMKGMGLVHHSDRGSQYLSIRYTERLAEAGIEPSVGSVGDSYDNALAETINGLFKAEVIHRRGPWRSFEAVEYATLEWVDWFNNRRLLQPIGKILPAEAKANFYATLVAEPMAA